MVMQKTKPLLERPLMDPTSKRSRQNGHRRRVARTCCSMSAPTIISSSTPWCAFPSVSSIYAASPALLVRAQTVAAN